MILTQALLNRVPNWATQEGWQVNDDVDWGDYSNCDTIWANKILNSDSFAAALNEHPPHRPSEPKEQE